MRVAAVVVVAVAETTTHAEPVAMTGPYKSLVEACAALGEHREALDYEHVADRCRVIDTAGSAAVLVDDLVVTVQATGAVIDRYRTYALALHRAAGWWLSPSVPLDLSGNAWGAGNCCSGRAEPPR